MVSVGAVRAFDDEVISDYQRSAALLLDHAEQAVHLAATGDDKTLLVAGERGVIHRSTDQGGQWHQVPVPIDVTLTTLTRNPNGDYWAGGHEETLLRSDDEGAAWTLIRSEHDGPPVLRIRFFDADTGFAVGGNGMVLRTLDGGARWERQQIVNSVMFDPHLFDIARLADGRLLIAAETGNLFRSDDGGETWVELESPYAGSFFGLVDLGDRGVVAYGMLSNAYLSQDGGDHWQQLDTDVTDSSFFSGHPAPGGVVLAGADGTLTFGTWRDGTLRFMADPVESRPAIADLHSLPRGGWLAATDRGPLIIAPQD